MNGNTGIFKTRTGVWRAIVNGRLIGLPYTGPGAKRAAIQTAGTNRRVDVPLRTPELPAAGPVDLTGVKAAV